MKEDYSNSKIYLIKNKIDKTLVGVGSTFKSLDDRFRCYKCETKTAIGKYINKNPDNWYIELYKYFPCDCKKELLIEEGKIIKQIATINKNIAGRTKKEYYTDNKQIIKEQMKQYYTDNKQIIKEQMKQYYADNKQIIKEQMKQNYIDNKQKRKEQMKQYYIDNKQKRKEQMKQYYQNKKNIQDNNH